MGASGFNAEASGGEHVIEYGKYRRRLTVYQRSQRANYTVKDENETRVVEQVDAYYDTFWVCLKDGRMILLDDILQELVDAGNDGKLAVKVKKAKQ